MQNYMDLHFKKSFDKDLYVSEFYTLYSSQMEKETFKIMKDFAQVLYQNIDRFVILLQNI